MPSARSTSWILAAVAAICLAVAATLLLTPSGSPSPADFGSVPTAARPGTEVRDPPSQDAGRKVEPGEAAPSRVRIPRVGLEAEVVSVGLGANGDVAVPGDPAQVGWYRRGPAPGDRTGSAVLAGHVDSETDRLGALAALYDVRAGDPVTVERKRGKPLRYQVVARQLVPRDRLPEHLFRADGPPVLTLITCAPPYDREQGGYQNNLVVSARPVR
ncbi:class F sortase [Streptomyces meridianus]|uniref:Class F sortase n=1 Tax=Streptomyces meridianus TaxID=2938945 RepID=A0ABT0X1X4_9ACTN|nr:class F sortase [Streptomyces meridianus]MCM2576300.1 class F sortase [Streptomyces meridianus]